jgi:hypothetical protein
MAAFSVVPNGDPFEEGAPSLLLSSEGAPVDQLSFQRGEEALDRGVVVTVPLPAHAADRSSLVE